MHKFDYFYTTSVNGTLEIEDIGNCCIEACTDIHECVYLLLDTKLGVTKVFQYGPIIPESEILEKSCICSFKRIDYSYNKIKKAIETFLNNPYIKITQAREIDKEKCFKNCINIIDYMKNPDSF